MPLSMTSQNQGGSDKKKRMLYQLGNLLYLLGWALSLVGLALVQDECKDHVRSTGSQYLGFESVAFFTHPVGDDCDKGFRFFWFVWALSTIPPLMAVIASIMPDLARGVSTSFFAVIAPLALVLANSWFDALHIAKSDMEKRMEVATAGFCVLGGASLLMLLLDALLSRNTSKDKHVHHHNEDRSIDMRGKRSLSAKKEPIMLPPLEPEPEVRRPSFESEAVAPRFAHHPVAPPPPVVTPIAAAVAHTPLVHDSAYDSARDRDAAVQVPVVPAVGVAAAPIDPPAGADVVYATGDAPTPIVPVTPFVHPPLVRKDPIL